MAKKNTKSAKKPVRKSIKTSAGKVPQGNVLNRFYGILGLKFRSKKPVRAKAGESGITRTLLFFRDGDKKRILFAALGGAFVLAFLMLYSYGYIEIGRSANIPDTSGAGDGSAMSSENRDLLDKVSKLIVLPEDEMPTIATVVDAEKLKGKDFFINAEDGDKVLIYSKSGKAILYSPKKGKIVEIAPIKIGNGNGTTDAKVEP